MRRVDSHLASETVRRDKRLFSARATLCMVSILLLCHSASAKEGFDQIFFPSSLQALIRCWVRNMKAPKLTQDPSLYRGRGTPSLFAGRFTERKPLGKARWCPP